MGQEVTGETRLGVIGTTAGSSRSCCPPCRPLTPGSRSSSSRPAPPPCPQLVTGHLDLAVVNLRWTTPRSTPSLFEEELVLLATRESPLADRESVSFADLAGHPLVLPPKGTALRQDLDAEARRTGVTLLPQAEIDGVRLRSRWPSRATARPSCRRQRCPAGSGAPSRGSPSGHGPAAGRPGLPPADDAERGRAGRGRCPAGRHLRQGPAPEGRAGLSWGPARAGPTHRGSGADPSHEPARSRARARRGAADRRAARRITPGTARRPQ